MDKERLEDRLRNREQQLAEMATQLSQHLEKLDKKNTKLAKLQNREKELEKKLKRKDEQLAQERSDKEILQSKLQELEKLAESHTPVEQSSVEVSDLPAPVPDSLDMISKDSTEEAEKLGLGELFKKYK